MSWRDCLARAATGQFWANAVTPRHGYRRYPDIVYGDGPRGRLDVYVPARCLPGRPVMVFFYGGGWRTGDKRSYLFVGQALAACGVTVVLPDYRLYPEVTFPAFVEDGAAAVAWTRQHIAAYGGDPAHVFVGGHSAGAHIAALLALDGRYLAHAAARPGMLAGFVGVSGPYDFWPIRDPGVRRILAPEQHGKHSQPIEHVDRACPAMLLVHGGADTVVGVENAKNLAARVNAVGGSVELAIYPRAGHVGPIAALAPGLRRLVDVRERMVRFVKSRVLESFG